MYLLSRVTLTLSCSHQMAHEAENIYNLALYKKKKKEALVTPGSGNKG